MEGGALEGRDKKVRLRGVGMEGGIIGCDWTVRLEVAIAGCDRRVRLEGTIGG